MKCYISNSCNNKELCCNFCSVKKCSDRCKENHKNCKYFNKAIYEEKSNPDENKKIIKKYFAKNV